MKSIIYSLFTLTLASHALADADFGPKIIFGDDNRQEVYSVAPLWQTISQSIAGKVSIDHIEGNTKLIGAPLSKKVCATNRFANQITIPSCTGFLAKPNILITAGHCMKTPEDCSQFVWIFGYTLKNETDQTYTNVDPSRIYKCKNVISRRFEDFGAVDYTIIELDRPVVGREPLKLGFDATVSPGMQVTSIGHPSGLPQKLIDGASIIQIVDNDRTLDTDLDAFQGNSGSPVFDASTGVVLGITSHGHADHIRDPEKLCKINKICMPGDKCYWSASSRITNLKDEPTFKN